MTTITVTADTLDNHVDFDRPFTLTPAGEDAATISYPGDITEPDVSLVQHGDVEVLGSRWAALTGYTGQHGYNGAVMHVSEVLGGRMADEMIRGGGTYVIVEVREEDGSYPEGDALGWAALTQIA